MKFVTIKNNKRNSDFGEINFIRIKKISSINYVGSAFKSVFQLFQFPWLRVIHVRKEKSHNNKLEYKQNALAVIYLIFFIFEIMVAAYITRILYNQNYYVPNKILEYYIFTYNIL